MTCVDVYRPGGPKPDPLLIQDEVYIVMDLCRPGSLRSLCHRVPLNERQLAYVTREVTKGLVYLHQ